MPAEVLSAAHLKAENGAPVSDLLAQVKMQAEYYFSDANLVKDKFIQKQLAADESNEGWLPLSLIAGFPRMKKLTRDVSVIRESLRDSSILVVNETGENVRRRIPFVFPEDSELKDQRKVYVSHVPKDATQESLSAIFSTYGEVKRIDLPVDAKGEVRGMAFVEYSTAEEAHLTLEEFPKRGEKEMTTIAFKVYKAEQIEKKKEKMKEKKGKKKEKEREKREKEESQSESDSAEIFETSETKDDKKSPNQKRENRRSFEVNKVSRNTKLAVLKDGELRFKDSDRERSNSLKVPKGLKSNAQGKEKRWSIEGGEPTLHLEKEKPESGFRLKHRSQPLPSKVSPRPRTSFLPSNVTQTTPDFVPIRQPLGPKEGKGFERRS